MKEIFPGKEDFQFSAGPSTYYSNIQSLDGGKSCIFVTVVSTLLTSTSLLADNPCGRHHNSVHFYSLARYIGVVTLVLFEAMMRRCSIFLESTMLQLISNSTYRDTLQDNEGDNEEDDGLDPLVRQTFEELPDLADALVMYEEHFLQQLMQSTVLIDGRESFIPHWFDAVLHYYAHRKNPVNSSSECICSLHLVKSEAAVSIQKTGSGNSNGKSQSNNDNSSKRNGAVASLLKIATISSSGNLERGSNAVWDRDITTFAGVMIQKLGDSLCKENECMDDSNCRVLLRLHEISAGNGARGELLVISLLTAGGNTLILSTSVSMDAVGVLDNKVSINTDSPALVAVLEKHTDVGHDNDKHSLLLFTANVLHVEFREAWRTARRAVAAAFFCNGQGASPASYKAAIEATIVKETKAQQTLSTAAVVDVVAAKKTQQAVPTAAAAVDVVATTKTQQAVSAAAAVVAVAEKTQQAVSTTAAVDAVAAKKTQQTLSTAAAAVDAVAEKTQQTLSTAAAVDVIAEGITVVTPFDPLAVLTPENTAVTAFGMTTPTAPVVTSTPTHQENGSTAADAVTVAVTAITATPLDLAVENNLADAIETRTADEVEYIPRPPSALSPSSVHAHGGTENTSRPSSSHSAKRPGRTLKLSDKHV